jgi:hypothetical protein
MEMLSFVAITDRRSLRQRQSMTDVGGFRIVVRYSRLADQWMASLEGEPQVVFGGESPIAAMRRLLDGLTAEPGKYVMYWIDSGDADAEDLFWTANWQPPELILL